MPIRLVIVGALLIGAAAMPLGAQPAWHTAVNRFQDCTAYTPIVVKPDGSIEVPEDLPGLEAPFPYTRELAFKVLLNTCEFRDTAVSSEGSSLFQFELLNVLWHQPDHAQVFEDLFQRGNLPGKLYALIGLYETNSKRFAELAPSVKKAGGTVVRHSGCTTMPASVASIMVEIENGSLSRDFRKVGTYMKWLPKVSH